jgi:mannose/fructose/N-acetylgalactosamine-specific phosphotransferase system component IID
MCPELKKIYKKNPSQNISNNNFFYNKSIMIKWGIVGQQIWDTYGQFQKKKIGSAINFILFQSSLKKK